MQRDSRIIKKNLILIPKNDQASPSLIPTGIKDLPRINRLTLTGLADPPNPPISSSQTIKPVELMLKLEELKVEQPRTSTSSSSGTVDDGNGKIKEEAKEKKNQAKIDKSLNQSRKKDPKKNTIGLVRDRVLTGMKKIIKIKKSDPTFADLKSRFEGLKKEDQERLRYIFVKINSLNELEHFNELKKFFVYMRNKYPQYWKKQKTWCKTKEFLLMPEFKNVGKMLRELMYELMFGSGDKDRELWLQGFRGGTAVKNYIQSDEFLNQLKNFLADVCKLQN